MSGWRFVCWFVVFLGVVSGAALAQIRQGVIIYGLMSDHPQFDSVSGDGVAEGNVALLTSEGFLTGERLQLRRGGALLSLEGNVFIVRNGQRIFASRVVIDRDTGEFVLHDVRLISDEDDKPIDTVNSQILGFSAEEIAFEAERNRRLKDLQNQLRDLREQYVRVDNLKRLERGKSPDAEAKASMVRQTYSLTLERFLRTKYQPNLIFDSLSPQARVRYEKRREAMQQFAQTDPNLFGRFTTPETFEGYADFRAKRVYRDSNGVIELSDATLTPCRCDGDVPPIYSLSSKVTLFEDDKYAHFFGMTANVAGVPVVYSPYGIFPVKRRRQSGFLRPFVYVAQSEQVIGIPFFLTLGEHADTTITATRISHRGWRLDNEFRFQLSPESLLETKFEVIEDLVFREQAAAHRKRVEEEIAEVQAESETSGVMPNTAEEVMVDEVKRAQLEAERKTPSWTRWYLRGSWSVPATAWGALKFDAESVSDSRYLSDFSNDNFDDAGAGSDLLTPSQTAQRFLGQQIAAEYYGQDFSFSIRTQALRDLYALRPEETPMRLPRIEFQLLPRRYFEFPLVVEHKLEWERVHRLEEKPYVDMVGVDDSVDITGTTLTRGRNGRKDAEEPYVEGERFLAKTRLTFPMPANDYVDAHVDLSSTYVGYHFDRVDTVPSIYPSASHLELGGTVSMPLYEEFSLRSSTDRTESLRLRHDLTPRVTTSYIPQVNRSLSYPTSFRLFYDSDDFASTQEVHFYLNSAWALTRIGFTEQRSGPLRLPSALDVGVSNETVLAEILLTQGLADHASTSEGLFELSDHPRGSVVFSEWSRRELEDYLHSVRTYEFDEIYDWPGETAYDLKPEWTMKAFNLGFHTSYNFLAERQEQEKNRNWIPGQAYVREEPWTDLEFTLGWSTQPLFPLSGGIGRNWSVEHHRWIARKISFASKLPLGFSANVSRSLVDTKATEFWQTTREDAYLLAYQPLSWLKLEYRQAFKVLTSEDPTYPRLSRTNEYETTSRISFLKLQDCLDIVISRDKKFEQREVEAVWSLVANLLYFGETREVTDLGRVLNREIHKSPYE